MNDRNPLPTNRIARVRAAKGLTQQAVADLVGSHWITISKLERGRMRLTEEWLTKLASALGVDRGELLPSERTLTTISVQGEIFPSGELSYYDSSDPHTITIHNSLFHHESLIWFYANTDALRPLFQDGDILGFRMGWGLEPDAFYDRICMFWISPTGKTVIGRLTHSEPVERRGRKHTITMLNGEILEDAMIVNFAPMKIVIADLNEEFQDEDPSSGGT